MKKTILALTTVALVSATLPRAAAGDREWATAGKVLTGVLAFGALAHALDASCHRTEVVYVPVPTLLPPPVYVQAPPAVVAIPPPRPVCYRPAPVYVQPAPVYVATAAVYAQPAPVYAAPTTAFVSPAPVVVAGPPVVQVGIGFRVGPPFPVRPGHWHHR
jgi:hypothetical protein